MKVPNPEITTSLCMVSCCVTISVAVLITSVIIAFGICIPLFNCSSVNNFSINSDLFI